MKEGGGEGEDAGGHGCVAWSRGPRPERPSRQEARNPPQVPLCHTPRPTAAHPTPRGRLTRIRVHTVVLLLGVVGLLSREVLSTDHLGLRHTIDNAAFALGFHAVRLDVAPGEVVLELKDGPDPIRHLDRRLLLVGKPPLGEGVIQETVNFAPVIRHLHVLDSGAPPDRLLRLSGTLIVREIVLDLDPVPVAELARGRHCGVGSLGRPVARTGQAREGRRERLEVLCTHLGGRRTVEERGGVREGESWEEPTPLAAAAAGAHFRSAL